MKLLGINDDADTCGLCGKTHLKRVMWIEDDEGNVDQYGTTCGAKKLGLNGKYETPEAVRDAFNLQEKRRINRERAEQSAQKRANETGESIAIMRNGTAYTGVTERQLNSNFYLYARSVLVKWIDPS